MERRVTEGRGVAAARCRSVRVAPVGAACVLLCAGAALGQAGQAVPGGATPSGVGPSGVGPGGATPSGVGPSGVGPGGAEAGGSPSGGAEAAGDRSEALFVRHGVFSVARPVDENWTLDVGGLVQIRAVGAFDAQDGAEGDEDSYDYGFHLPRARFGFGGRMGRPELTYRVLTQADNSGDFDLFDAWVQWEFHESWGVRLGQFKLPFDRERYVTSPVNTLASERSVLDPTFALVRGQGVQVSHQGERFRASAAFSDGQRGSNRDWTDPAEADVAISARAEGRFGEAAWRQFDTMAAFRGDSFGALLGAGVHYQQDGTIRVPVGAMEADRLLAYTADLGFEGDGWNVMAAFMGRTIDSDIGEFTDLGFLVQGGVAVCDHADVFARYAIVLPDDDRAGGSDDFSAITLGSNYYFIPRSTTLRLTGEVTYYPTARDDAASVISAPGIGQGYLRDSEDGQVAFVVQLQVRF